MFLFLPKARRLLPAFIIALLTLCPLFSQEKITGVEDDADIGPIFDEDILLLEGEGITVTGSPETTQQMKVVTKEEIERHNAPDLATLLQETLNLGVTGYGGYGSQTGINMRGFDSERIAFLIDGIPANSTMTGDFDLSQLDLNAIERIEIIYGGSDTKYNVSGALGGVINIITAKKNKPGWRIGGSISNTSAIPGEYRKRGGGTGNPQWQDLADTQNIALSTAFGSEKFSWSFNQFANRAGNHFLYTDYTDTVRRNESNEVWDTGASTSFIWNLPDTYSKLIASADLYYGDKNIPTKRGSSDVGKQTDFSTRQNIMLDMPRVGRDDLATEVSLSHAWQTLEYEPPAGSSSLHDQQVITAINRWTWYPRSWLTLRSGWDYRFNYLDSTDIGLRSRHDGGLYLTAEYKAHEKFLIIPSVKAVFSSPSKKPVVPVPKLGLLWKPLESLTLKNNYFRSFKYPDFEDLYWSGGGMHGNPDLKPEDGWGADLGAEYRYKWLGLESTVYGEWTKDSIHWDNPGGVWGIENAGEAVLIGWDSKASLEIPVSLGLIKKIVPSLSYQYMMSRLLSYGYTWASEKWMPYMPMHTIGASLYFFWGAKDSPKAGSLLISGHYESLRYTKTDNITKLDPHFLLNVNVNQQIGKNLTAFAAARNLLNTSYESFDDYPMPGITVTLGVRFNFEPTREKPHD